MILPEPKTPSRVTGLPTVDPTVVVVKTSPQSVLDDIQRGMEQAGVASRLDRRSTTILKDNISWHFPFPAANTTPWQL